MPVDTAEEFLRAVAKLRAAGEDRLIVEERLIGDATIAGEGRGDYVSVESVVDDDRIVHVGITREAPARSAG